ncbi:hypothetical protein [Myroides sp.]|uniref:hypothetical protein n=1 Tax=Myroides sp. TaxID=1874736 RepID=UPI0028AD4012|nr:hypothetical protein [Myroides sp.]
MKLKHITTVILSCLFIYSTNSYAQEEPTENTAVNLVEEVSQEKTTDQQQPKEDKKKKKKSGSPTLPPNNSTAYLLHVGEDEFVRDNIAKHYSDQRFYEWTLSAGVSTMGLTLEALTPINSYLKLRGGINLFFFNSKHYDVGIDDPQGDLVRLFGYKPNLAIKGKNHMIHAHTLVDFYPVPDGLFFLSGGFYFGQNKTALDGYLINHQGDRAKPLYGEWPEYLDFQGNQIKLNEGNMEADVTLGSIIKPYLGIGIGRVVTNKKLGFSFELGMMYQGDYELKQDGSKVLFNLEDSFEYNEKGEKWLNRIKWWPKVSFQVRYRLF